MSGRPGQRKHRALSESDDRGRMWKSMRMLREFTPPDVEATAEASKANVRKYIKGLATHGYLQLQRAATGQPGGHAIWRLVKNTGPVAPRLSKDGLYDANVAEPLPRSGDRPLTRAAPWLLKSLRELVDEIHRNPAASTQRMRELADGARVVILKAEGRAGSPAAQSLTRAGAAGKEFT